MQVLLVDDHLDTRAICTAVVTNLGHSVKAVSTVKDAIAAAERQPFDLLICDIMLPDGNGYELMRYLSSQSNLRGIALTGCASKQDVLRSHEAGFVRHLAKPFDLARLEDAINELCPVAAT